jgi:hypothetical protein
MNLLELSAAYSKISLLNEIQNLMSSMKAPNGQMPNVHSSLNFLQMSLQQMNHATTMKLEGLISKSHPSSQGMPHQSEQWTRAANFLAPPASQMGAPKIILSRIAQHTPGTAGPLQGTAYIPTAWNWNVQAIGIPLPGQATLSGSSAASSQFVPSFPRRK